MCKIRRLRVCPVDPLDVLCVLFRFETESNNLLSACKCGEDSRFGLNPPPHTPWPQSGSSNAPPNDVTLLDSNYFHNKKTKKMQFLLILDLIAVFVAISKVSEGFFFVVVVVKCDYHTNL